MKTIYVRILTIAAIAMCSFFSVGCAIFGTIEPGLDMDGYAPEKKLSCTDSITESGIGPISLRDGDGSISAHCKGFWQTAPGGFGNTYEVQAWNGWVVIECAYDRCCYIGVSGGLYGTGWQGQTERGIKLGASIKEFREKYPEAHFSVLKMGYVVGDRLFKFGPFGLRSIQFGERNGSLL